MVFNIIPVALARVGPIGDRVVECPVVSVADDSVPRPHGILRSHGPFVVRGRDAHGPSSKSGVSHSLGVEGDIHSLPVAEDQDM